MKKTRIVRLIIAVFLLAASLFLVSGALATTENECISGGGSVSAGSGCKFCVGGKFDLQEISDSGKSDTGRSGSGSEQKAGDKTSGQSGSGTTKNDH